MSLQHLTILCPVYNEAKVVPLFFERMRPVIEELSSVYKVDLVFLNNASSDETATAIRQLIRDYPYIYLLTLSRNEGYQRSLESGLRNTEGDLFAFIDVDCEDPPEMLRDFAAAIKRGYQIVYGERVDREENLIIKSMRKMFYRITRLIADDEIVLNMAEFSMMTAEVRNAIIQDTTSFPFIRASVGRVGFKRLGIPYKRHRRIGGLTHYNFFGMAKFALTGILSSTTLFLRLPVYFLPLFIVLVGALGYVALQSPDDWRWSIITLLVAASIYIGSSLAFVAMYLARIHKNTLGRPNSFINLKQSVLQRSKGAELGDRSAPEAANI